MTQRERLNITDLEVSVTEEVLQKLLADYEDREPYARDTLVALREALDCLSYVDQEDPPSEF